MVIEVGRLILSLSFSIVVTAVFWRPSVPWDLCYVWSIIFHQSLVSPYYTLFVKLTWIT
uniref:Uncharacterized protein n=1 Tax=Rhizophora mucronata TaxID=61149 RepID=A0A2P2QU94_RHIMU